VIERLVGVYDADGTAVGEVAYWVGARLGRRHCGLCDITHGRFREREAWRAERARLPVPFQTFHRNDQPSSIRTASGDVAPVVAAATADGPVVLLGPDDLARCDRSPAALVDAIEDRVQTLGLSWSSRTS
jgi:hypothetical protein